MVTQNEKELRRSGSEKHFPQPKTYGPLKNIPLIDKNKPTQSFLELQERYGDIFRFETPTGKFLFISGHDLVADACDETRFDKYISPPLEKLRPLGGDGLFTAATSEENWQKAHRLLVPSFSQRAMQGYHHMMSDMASQLIQKWSRLNEEETIDVAEDMSRLTYDTIGLCGFSYRFNSFYRDDMHPFVKSMVNALDEAMNQMWRLGIQQRLMVRHNQQFKANLQVMYELVDRLITERKVKQKTSETPRDLLHFMLNGKDPVTGEGLSDENIRYQIITFLIAGHETTSGLLTFAIYYLLKNPHVLQKAYEEVDQVLKSPIPTYEEVRSLRYIWMILNESLRLWPTAPQFSVFAKEDTVLAGRYPIKKGTGLSINIPMLHRDKRVWGEEANQFIPERFSDMTKVPYDAFKPFGNGQRACIGQLFAMHEATLVLGMILRQFDLVDPSNYQLDIKETLTLKPDQLRVQARPRTKTPIMGFSHTHNAVKNSLEPPILTPRQTSHQTPLLVLYGSDLGTAEGLARELADVGESFGFTSKVGNLNDYIDQLPKGDPVILVASSYNGKPPVRAKSFIEWLEQLPANALKGVRYTVFGCGDRNWKSTYQAIPRLIDGKMADCGAERLAERGEGDASQDFEAQWMDWQTTFWPQFSERLGLSLRFEMEPSNSPALTMEWVHNADGPIESMYQAVRGTVLRNVELQAPTSGRSTRHLEIQLPKGMTYEVGDHIGIVPEQQEPLIQRVLDRFQIDQDTSVILHAHTKRTEHLPIGNPVQIKALLRCSVELQEPLSRQALKEMIASTDCPPHKKELETYLKEAVYQEEILKKRISLLELLETYPSCEMSFERFLALLPPLKARFYSISSAPSDLVTPPVASLTVAVVCGEAWSGKGIYKGIASTYLASRKEGEIVRLFLKHPESGFTLPEEPTKSIIMVGAGTGLAPFRGFLHARQQLKQKGVELGEARLYFGCRNEEDFIYKEELEAFKEDEIVDLYTAFSRKEGQKKTYVQHLLEEQGEEIIERLSQGSLLYVCGDGRWMAPDIEETLIKIYKKMNHVTYKEAEEWMMKLQHSGHYLKDVWAG